MPSMLFFRDHHLAVFYPLLVLALAISGCSTMVGPDYVKPTVSEPEKWIESGNPKIENKEVDFSQW